MREETQKQIYYIILLKKYKIDLQKVKAKQLQVRV
jgi:hypothetical protein